MEKGKWGGKWKQNLPQRFAVVFLALINKKESWHANASKYWRYHISQTTVKIKSKHTSPSNFIHPEREGETRRFWIVVQSQLFCLPTCIHSKELFASSISFLYTNLLFVQVIAWCARFLAGDGCTPSSSSSSNFLLDSAQHRAGYNIPYDNNSVSLLGNRWQLLSNLSSLFGTSCLGETFV